MPVRLHPPGQPFDHRMVEVSGGHRIYVEQYGTPGGLPVVVLHGGPGGGIHPNIRRFFDPKCFHVTLFDQRGCGNSRPHASVENNTTWDLIEDIETIRSLLGISRWIVFGGSWGATLGILYAQQHPERVMQLILRGPFLFTQSELDWFYGGGVAAFFPDQWKKFVEVLPEDKRDDVIAGFHEGLFGSDPEIRARYAAAWTRWENGLASIGAANESAPVPADYALAFARLENHYFFNRGFLESDDQILQNMDAIQDIFGIIVQGRYDMICPPAAAFRLHAAWPRSQLHVIPDAGHSISEPGIAARLLRSMDLIAETRMKVRGRPGYRP